MRFRLVEYMTNIDIPEEYYTEWRTADAKRKELIAREILQRMGSNEQERKALTNVAEAFIKSCFRFGITYPQNPFINYIPTIAKKVKLEPKHDDYISALIDLVESGSVLRESVIKSLTNKDSYLVNESLFYRSVADFIYTAKILEIVTTKTQLSKFFKDTSVVKEEELYEDNRVGGRIKPAGNENTPDNQLNGTIYGTVEKWSDGGENDAGGHEDRTSAKDNKKYSPQTLERIKENKRYNNVSEIPESEEYEGNIVYVYFSNEHDSKDIDFNNFVDTWLQYRNGKWGVYNPK